MQKSTKERLLDAAEKLFAKNGFYGTSIREIAEQIGLTKQALLHHFKTKEKLYAAVLERVALLLHAGVKEAIEEEGTELEKLERVVDYLSAWPRYDVDGPMLVMRELLDNQERALHAEKWVMLPMISELTQLVKSGQEKGQFKKLPPLLFIYHLLGAQHYFLVSLPTLRRLAATDEEYEEVLNLHIQELKLLLRARLLVEG